MNENLLIGVVSLGIAAGRGLPHEVSTDRHAAISDPETRAVYRCRP